ncbi:Sulphatase-modifying factor domain protein [Candidatus Thiomargarita nelsonii]|uniref:Sulphatase-modifying factor domain protein n=1 Tax=Candidatus Thiomargarita nelsonii TaxID=1003181 RepID=A0A176S7A8_9GAMM|nr:Sulphatase-modifying factor domain protein [Candidatus Thiomargarita nelsonii]
MVWIPAGSFRMGDIQGSGGSDDKSVHRVSVNRFAMGRYEVTVGSFRKFIESSSYKTIADRFGSCSVYENRGFQWKRGANWDRTNFSQSEISPVVCVSWTDAVAYTKWLSEQTGHKYQLPTEEQWEYAARAGTKTNYWWGNEGTHEYANYGKGLNSVEREKKLSLKVTVTKGKDQWVYTSPVGSFYPNQFGLYDIAGNVREWVSGEYKGNGKDLIKSWDGEWRMMRGGSWYDVPRALYFRGLYTNSTDRNTFVGFRVSRELD